jgi:hypothetical protein
VGLTYVALDGKQPGNPARAAQIILDVVRGEGVAQGKAMPDALPLGVGAVDAIKDILKKRLALIEEWEAVARSADEWV